MQTPTWYARRLRSMTAAEITWRAGSALSGVRDRIRFALGLYPSLLTPPPRQAHPGAGCSLCQVAAGAWASADPDSIEGSWAAGLAGEADDLVAHRFSFLNLERVYLGDPVDWNRDPETGAPSPLKFAGSIDYRDVRTSGDAKMVWEPSRHLHLGVLGRAYRATGDSRYIRAAIDHAVSWMRQCPAGVGMNWRSPLELAIRTINWTWLLDLAEPSGVVTGLERARLLHGIDVHVQEIARKYSRGSSANNHRIGEAAGVFIATSCLPGLRDASRLRHRSREILVEEILAQHHPDGGNCEQAFGYHLFVLQFLLLAELVAIRTGQPMPESFCERLGRSVDFAAALLEAGPAPMYGDADDGYVLDLGGRASGGREIVALGEALLGRRAHGPPLEPPAWLVNREPYPGGADDSPTQVPLVSRAFADTGLYLLQWGNGERGDSASATFDCGALGFGAIAAHGHADALSITLRAFGEDVLVDPGTFDYFRYPEWRDYFRSTRAHNTITIDGADQSVMLGPFMWGDRANTRCLEWAQDGRRARVVGEHDGYTRLTDPVHHRRVLEMDADARVFALADTLTMVREHRVDLYFHVSERAAVRRSGDRHFTIALPGGTVTLELDSQLSVAVLEGAEAPIGGWVSRGYHRKEPAITIVASLTARGALTLHSRLRVQPQP